MRHDYIQIITTTPEKSIAEDIAKKLLDKHLVACAQIEGPITSYYWWEGKQESAAEWRCTLKSTTDLYPVLERVILDLHPYQTPEILAVPINQGYPPYLKWIDTETKNLKQK